jgi:hypothetical protein
MQWDGRRMVEQRHDGAAKSSVMSWDRCAHGFQGEGAPDVVEEPKTEAACGRHGYCGSRRRIFLAR